MSEEKKRRPISSILGDSKEPTPSTSLMSSMTFTGNAKIKNLDMKKLEKWKAENPYFKRKLLHITLERQADDFWLKPCKIACWWCGHFFPHPPIPLPNKVKNGEFIINEEIFCTFTCVKSEIVEKQGYQFSERIEAFTLMLNDVYKYTKPVSTIQKLMFQRYGGPLSYEDFLQNYAVVDHIRIVGVPFVDTPIAFESDFKDVVVPKKKKPIKKLLAETQAIADDVIASGKNLIQPSTFEDIIPTLT